MRTGAKLALGVLVLLGAAAGVRWGLVYRDLNRPQRREAWEQIRREHIHDLRYPAAAVDPRAVRLWLATGRDPNGADCAIWGRPPRAFEIAFVKPLGLCAPANGDAMPFITATFYAQDSDGAEALRLMIAAGASVNGVSRDGVVPLRSAVLHGNELVVALLLKAGADPRVHPTYSAIGDLRSALEVAESKPSDPVSTRIRDMLRAASESRSGNPRRTQ